VRQIKNGSFASEKDTAPETKPTAFAMQGSHAPADGYIELC
jgi:hypothetical protein